jgi:hypothetical protein
MKYNHITTLTIGNELVIVSIDFEMQFGEAIIIKMTNMETNEAIAPDLLEEIESAEIYKDLYELANELNH